MSERNRSKSGESLGGRNISGASKLDISQALGRKNPVAVLETFSCHGVPEKCGERRVR